MIRYPKNCYSLIYNVKGIHLTIFLLFLIFSSQDITAHIVANLFLTLILHPFLNICLDQCVLCQYAGDRFSRILYKSKHLCSINSTTVILIAYFKQLNLISNQPNMSISAKTLFSELFFFSNIKFQCLKLLQHPFSADRSEVVIKVLLR